MKNNPSTSPLSHRTQGARAVTQRDDEWCSTLDILTDMIAIIDTNFRVVRANQAMVKRLGITPEQTVGKTHRELGVSDQTAEQIESFIQQVLDTGQMLDSEITFTNRMGTEHYLVRATPMPGPSALFVLRNVTDHQRTAEERRKFFLGIECSNDAIFMTALDGTIEYINPAFEKIYGYTKEETLGKTPRILKSNLYDQSVYQHFWKTLLDKQVVKSELVNKTKEGQLINIEGSANPILNDAGDIIGFLAIQRDITARKRAEQELAFQKSHFQQLFENSPVAIALLDIHDQIQNINAAFTELFQYRAEEVVGQFINDMIVSPEKHGEASYLSALVLKGGTVQIETVRKRKDNASVAVQIYAAPVLQGGNSSAIYAMYADVTERKNAEAKLRESEARFRSLVQSQGEGVAIIDADENFTFANPAAERIFGVPSGTLVGKNLREFASPKQLATILKETHHRRRGKHNTYEIEIIRPDHKNRSLIVTATPQQTKAKGFIGALAVFRDITERKQMEEQLKFASTHDALTNIFNRAFFEAELTRLERSREYPVSIAIIDADDMKKTNDALGHSAGDSLLRRIADLLKSIFRTSDIIARIGGDEFAVLLPLTDAASAAHMLARVKQTVQVYNVGHPANSLNFSLGIATGEKGMRLVDVMKQADNRMYQDKIARNITR